ncbi:MAG: nucleotidyl transferase AbiEii/AbiGii toxin family protein, partial [Dehalococcoidia bacterium]
MTVEPPDAVEIRRRLRRRPGRRRPARARRYGLERLLYRLGRLQHANAFVLKGAMLFHLWSEELHRPTRDLDLLGSGESSVARLEGVFRKICAVEVKNDGLRFDAAAVRGAVIREGQHY